jgi:hypothetical protein
LGLSAAIWRIIVRRSSRLPAADRVPLFFGHAWNSRFPALAQLANMIGMSGALTFEMDDAANLVRVCGTGLWTPEQTLIHFLELHRAILGLRAVRRKVLVVVDLRAAAVQTAETAAAVRDGTARIYRDADYVAIVCSSALVAMQMKRAAQVPNLATFAELGEALDWMNERRVALAS